MANMVTTFIKVTDGPESEVKRFIEENKDIDFNDYVKVPKEVDFVMSNRDEEARQEMMRLMTNHLNKGNESPTDLSSLKDKFTDSEIENAKRAITNEIKYGFSSWYPWSVDNWGTSSVAFETANGDDFIVFDTKWCPPTKIFDKMAERYPQLTMDIYCVDEYLEGPCGKMRIEKGKASAMIQPEALTDEAVDIHFTVFPGKKRYWKKVDGKWSPIPLSEVKNDDDYEKWPE